MEKIIIVDVYGDADVYRVYVDSPEARRDVAAWRDLDARFDNGELDDSEYVEIERFMRERGHRLVYFEII